MKIEIEVSDETAHAIALQMEGGYGGTDPAVFDAFYEIADGIRSALANKLPMVSMKPSFPVARGQAMT